MDIKSIKSLASEYTKDELLRFADELEKNGTGPVVTQDDPGDQMSDYLQAAEIRQIMETDGDDLNQAVRKFAVRVRGALKS